MPSAVDFIEFVSGTSCCSAWNSASVCRRKGWIVTLFVPSVSSECEHFLEDGLSGVCTSSQGILKRESGSESEFFSLPGDGMDDIVFGKVSWQHKAWFKLQELVLQTPQRNNSPWYQYGNQKEMASCFDTAIRGTCLWLFSTRCYFFRDSVIPPALKRRFLF